jgi:hypothetical protein
MLCKIPQHFFNRFIVKSCWGFFGVVSPYLDFPLASGSSFYLIIRKKELRRIFSI